MKKRIWLPESPYTFVRVTVMRTMLIPKSDYSKLLKMSLPEISTYLSGTTYKEDINELGVYLGGIELIEQVLDRNFMRTIEKLKRISPEHYTLLINAYLLRWDIENIKTILRAQETHQGKEDTKKLFTPGGVIPWQKLESLLERKSVEEILKSLPFPLSLFYDGYAKSRIESRAELETALDRFYYNYTIEFSSRIPRQGGLFKEFLLTLIDASNMLAYLRLRREGLPNEEIRKHLFLADNPHLFERLLKANTSEQITKLIKDSKYANIPINLEGSGSLIPSEIALHQFVYRKTLQFSHQNPLSVYAILAYLFTKEMEIMNLRKIIKAKYLGMPNEMVENQLVIA